MTAPAPHGPSRFASGHLRLTPFAAAASLALLACEAEPPPTREHLVLEGDDYARGLAHGTQLRSKVRSFYTTMLTNTLLPYLNREHAGIAEFLPEYRKPRYGDGKFSREVLLDSAKELERQIPQQYRDELRGIADGSGLTYDEVLILNTFPDTVLTVRAVAAAIHLARAPRILSVQVEGLESDGRDNDEDGVVDEPGEGLISPFEPSPTALLSSVPPGAKVRFVLEDPDGVDPATLRLTAGGRVFGADSDEVEISQLQEPPGAVSVAFAVPADAGAGGALTLVVGAGDRAVSSTVPLHANFMREERLTFVLSGDPRARHEVPNVEADKGRTQPPSLAFAVRGAASATGGPLLAHNFALLDANTAHKHGAVFEHRPAGGGAPFVVVGWAGIVWGFSGMNGEGLSAACNPGDSLDNAIVGRFIEQLGEGIENMRLLMRGRPIGITLRRVLERRKTALEGRDEVAGTVHGAGWSCLFADEDGGLRAVEVDADVSKDGPFVDFGPETSDPANLDAHGRPYASVGPDDLRIGAHFRKNTNDMYELSVLGQRIAPQRYWSSQFYRSVQAWTRLGEALSARGPLDADGAKALLQSPDLMDVRDSMNAVVYEPSARRYHVAMGQVPAPLAAFQTFELGGAP